MDEQLQQQVTQLVQAALQGNQQARQQIQQIIQAAQQGDQQAQQVAQLIQQVAQQIQGQQQNPNQIPSRKFGAKLNYIKQLRGKCPEGYEMKYYAKGGRMCKTCQRVRMSANGNEMKQNMKVADQFKAKCGKKIKKKV